jgi:hypothetical protein
LTEDRFQGHHLPVFSEEKEIAMTIEQVPQEEFPYHLLFKPLVSPPPEPDEEKLIKKYLKRGRRKNHFQFVVISSQSF